MTQDRPGLPHHSETKSSGVLAESYGVGTCIALDRPMGSMLRLLVAAVTSDRQGQGLRSEMGHLVDCVRNSLFKALALRGVHHLALPLLGAGHGGLRPEVSLATMLLALSDAIRLAARKPASVTIVVYRDPKTQRVALAPDAIHDILGTTARWLA